MTKRAERPASRHNILIFDEDWEFLKNLYAVEGPVPLGPVRAVREIVHKYVKKMRESVRQELDASKTPPGDAPHV